MVNYITANSFSAIILLIIVLGTITKKKKYQSSIVFMNIAISSIICSLLSIACCYVSSPETIANIVRTLSYISIIVNFMVFLRYWYVSITERTTLRSLFYSIPMVVLSLTALSIAFGGFSGRIFVENTVIPGHKSAMPSYVLVVQLSLMIYVTVIAFLKREAIGIKAAILFGLFGIIPFSCAVASHGFGVTDYSVAGGAFSLLLIYVLLENVNAVEREEEQASALSVKNDELAAVNEEQLAQLEEIKDLNTRLEHSHIELSNQLAVIKAIARRYFCVHVVNIESDSFHEVVASPNVRELLGREGKASATLVYGCNILVHPEDREEMMEFHDLSRWPEYLNGRDMYSCEYRGITSGWSRATIFIAERDESGMARKVIYTLEQIHEQKETEQELEAQIREITKLNNRLSDFNNIIANAGYGIWHILIKKGSASRMIVNEKMAELLAIDASEMTEEEIYNSWYDRVSPEAIPSVSASVEEMIAGNFSENTYVWIHPQKGAIYVRCGGTSSLLEDGTVVLSGYHADVTEIVKKEKEAQEKELQYQARLKQAAEDAELANQAKTAFLFNMSHDIRTPMNAIMGFRELLEKHQEEPEKRQDYLKKIEEASEVLLSIINNVLEMARIEKGTLVLDETVWSAEQFNDTLYSMFWELMAQKDIRFTREIHVTHNYVYCDAIKLREVFMNILSNACKYTNPGGAVSMVVEEIPGENPDVVNFRTTISDNGIGMSEEFLPHIYEEFTRENNTTDAKIEGTGLGMPIVKRLVELMNGTIEVQSKKGVGTTFIVTIPHRIADKSVLVERAGIEFDPKLFENKRILLAEDNDLNAEIAIELLGESGFILERAADGAICVDMLKTAEPGYYDLILMDIQMPNMNGYEATIEIRGLEDAEKSGIPILAMTANAFEEDRREAFRVGMNGHLAKPINVSEMLKALTIALT